MQRIWRCCGIEIGKDLREGEGESRGAVEVKLRIGCAPDQKADISGVVEVFDRRSQRMRPKRGVVRLTETLIEAQVSEHEGDRSEGAAPLLGVEVSSGQGDMRVEGVFLIRKQAARAEPGGERVDIGVQRVARLQPTDVPSDDAGGVFGKK